MAEKTARKQRRRGRPFVKGTSGNPKGRPLGARNRATIIAQTFLDNQAEALAAKAVEMALMGDTVALRLCLERLVPPRREAPVSVKLPSLAKAGDAATAMSAILKAAGEGEITSGEAAAFASLIDQFRKAVETAELERRIAMLEEMSANERP
ncbi:MAG: hypothetical protein GEU87_17945 [Alphaproteobacteria bacterium]|nr:hypothetical protein [Alphaproteobacteria bacterium]